MAISIRMPTWNFIIIIVIIIIIITIIIIIITFILDKEIGFSKPYLYQSVYSHTKCLG